MDRTFSNKDAAICGIIAIVEIIVVLAYVITTGLRLQNKIISMGRLIPALHMVVVAGTVLPNQMYPPNQYNGNGMQQTPYSSTQPPPPPGFYPPQNYPPQDYPPPYSTLQTKP